MKRPLEKCQKCAINEPTPPSTAAPKSVLNAYIALPSASPNPGAEPRALNFSEPWNGQTCPEQDALTVALVRRYITQLGIKEMKPT